MAKQKTTIQANQTVEEAFEQIIRADLAHINQWTPIALKGKDIEGVHQMRVVLRRMRSALTLFSPAIPRRNIKKLAKEMRWSARQLDRARDLDVYIADNLSPKEIKGDKSKKRLRKVALKHRKKAYKQVRSFIKGRRFESFMGRLPQWLDEKGWQQNLNQIDKDELTRPITRFASQVLDDHRCLVLTAGRNIQRKDDEALHRLRIECKKLRYATDFFMPLYKQEMAIFSRHLKQLQNVLGLLHDCYVMSGLQDSLLKGKKAKKLTDVTSRLMDQRRQSALDLREVLFGTWESFTATKLPWLG